MDAYDDDGAPYSNIHVVRDDDVRAIVRVDVVDAAEDFCDIDILDEVVVAVVDVDILDDVDDDTARDDDVDGLGDSYLYCYEAGECGDCLVAAPEGGYMVFEWDSLGLLVVDFDGVVSLDVSLAVVVAVVDYAAAFVLFSNGYPLCYCCYDAHESCLLNDLLWYRLLYNCRLFYVAMAVLPRQWMLD